MRLWWKRPGVVVRVGLMVAAVIVVAGALFQPWRLFVDQRVDEALPAVPGAPASTSDETNGPTPAPSPAGASRRSASPTTPAPPATAQNPKASAQNPKASAGTRPAQNQVTHSGRLISHEHPTSGVVSIIQQTDGTKVLRIEDLDTTNGPDLRVWLSSAPVREGRDGWFVFKDQVHLELGELKANQGNQNYPLPESADLDKFGSVTIWCKRFGVSFGAAELTAS